MFGPNPDRGVYPTTNGGQTWERILYRGESAGAMDLSIDPANPKVIIAALNHHVTYPWDEESSGATTGLFKTTDGGSTWQRITKGIRENDYSWVIREDPVRLGLLYAGTETGAYVSFDAGNSWQSLQRNLPPTMVMHMLVKGDDLVVATHGRGFWIMDNISSLRAITPEVAAGPLIER
jgi:photosystem II stability/assembly factor-like uncharacterized protein